MAPPTLLERMKKNIRELKRTRFAWNTIACETLKVSGGKSIFLIFQKYVIPGHFSLKRGENICAEAKL